MTVEQIRTNEEIAELNKQIGGDQHTIDFLLQQIDLKNAEIKKLRGEWWQIG